MVPLEKNMVRFIDNFSQGDRGAISAEYFLSKGYSVLYLYRKGTRTPFTRAFSNVIGAKVDSNLLSRVSQSSSHEDEIVFKVSRDNKRLIEMESTLLNDAFTSHRLAMVSFESVQEYLALLQGVAQGLAAFGPRVCFYLAAAVSDFYVPPDELVEHKIQSSGGDLALRLAQVPKKLGALRHDWAPHAFVVSFKLETDADLLLAKARRAVAQYGVHCVVANLLPTRKTHCAIVTPSSPSTGGAAECECEVWQVCSEGVLDVEQRIIQQVATRHLAHMRNAFASLLRTSKEVKEVEQQAEEVVQQMLCSVYGNGVYGNGNGNGTPYEEYFVGMLHSSVRNTTTSNTNNNTSSSSRCSVHRVLTLAVLSLSLAALLTLP